MNLLLIGTILIGIFLFITWFAKTSSKKISNSIRILIIFLIVITIIYGFIILRAGFFLSTSLFLFFSYYFLGERRWIWMFVLSFPFVATFMFLLHGLLDIYLRDPILKMIGIIG